MLAVRTRQLTAEDFHLFRLAALSAAPGASTLMETELQDVCLAVYPRNNVLFQPTDRTNPSHNGVVRTDEIAALSSVMAATRYPQPRAMHRRTTGKVPLDYHHFSHHT